MPKTKKATAAKKAPKKAAPKVAAPTPAQPRPGWQAPTVLPVAKKSKRKKSVAVIPDVVDAGKVDEAYEAKQRLDNAEAEFKVLADEIKQAATDFNQGQTTTINLPGTIGVAAQVSIKRDTLSLKDPAKAKELAGPLFHKWFREEVVGVIYTVAHMDVPKVKAALQAAGIDPGVIVEATQASYAVAEDWQKDQPYISTFLGGDEEKVEALKGCVEVARKGSTSLKFVGIDED